MLFKYDRFYLITLNMISKQSSSVNEAVNDINILKRIGTDEEKQEKLKAYCFAIWISRSAGNFALGRLVKNSVFERGSL